MRVTLKDIAQRLNMNESTVSYALNGKGSIKGKTRELVQATAREMGYVPNQSARQTSTGKSDEVAIVVPNVMSIYGEFCEYAFQMLADAGLRCNISISEFSVEREEVIINDMIGRGVAGILIVPSREFDYNGNSGVMRLLKKHAIPVVCRSDSPEYPGVGVDFRSIGMMMGEKLQEAGRRKICIASPQPPPFFSNINKIYAGLKKVLGDDVEIRIEYVDEKERSESALNYEHVLRQMLTPNWYAYHRKLFHKIFDREEDRPDAIVSPTESCLMGLMNEADSCGINIPRDVSVISGTRNVSGFIYPKLLTAVYVPEEEIAREMVSQLLNKIRKKQKLKKVLIEPVFFAGATL